MPRIVPDAIVRVVRQRANGLCEYCRFPEELSGLSFEVDHIIARVHGGTDEDINLAWACAVCNAYKGPNLTSIDPRTGSVTELYHPRNQAWRDHFVLSDGLIQPLTATGRATVKLLRMNEAESVFARRIYFIVNPA